MNIRYNVFRPDGSLHETVNFNHKLSVLEIRRILIFKDKFPSDIVIQRA